MVGDPSPTLQYGRRYFTDLYYNNQLLANNGAFTPSGPGYSDSSGQIVPRQVGGILQMKGKAFINNQWTTVASMNCTYASGPVYSYEVTFLDGNTQQPLNLAGCNFYYPQITFSGGFHPSVVLFTNELTVGSTTYVGLFSGANGKVLATLPTADLKFIAMRGQAGFQYNNYRFNGQTYAMGDQPDIPVPTQPPGSLVQVTVEFLP